jgi:hypothetical protein
VGLEIGTGAESGDGPKKSFEKVPRSLVEKGF